jgi:hypothetical protein
MSNYFLKFNILKDSWSRNLRFDTIISQIKFQCLYIYLQLHPTFTERPNKTPHEKDSCRQILETLKCLPRLLSHPSLFTLEDIVQYLFEIQVHYGFH